MTINLRSTLSKSTIFLFLLYLFWYKEAIGHSSILLYGGAFIVLLSTLFYINKKPISTLKVPKGIHFWIIYIFYSMITGFFLTEKYQELLSSLSTFLAFLVVIVCISIVCIGEKSIEWIFRSIIIISFLCSFYTIFHGYPYYNGVIVRTMGPENNPNDLGLLLVVGIFCCMYFQNREKRNFLIIFLSVSLFIYVIILSGSKKALLSASLLITIWIIEFVKYILKQKDKLKALFVLFTFLIVLLIAFKKLTKVFFGSVSYERMLLLFSSGSSIRRAEMYKQAWKFFLENPLFGVGYDQFRYRSTFNTYSHSTYAELISCSGFIGSVIFFVPIVICTKEIILGFFKDKSYRKGILLAFILVELFLGTVTIYMYQFQHILMWSLLFLIVDKRTELVDQIEEV